MAKLIVIVPADRKACGRALLLSVAGVALLGPIRVLATASRRVARRHGNPTCSPHLPFGHPPSGKFLVTGSLPPGFLHRRPGRYGRLGALLLEAEESPGGGLAPRRIALHGGPLDSEGRLRPTRGGVRVSDEDLLNLLTAVNAAYRRGDPLSVVEIIEVEPAVGPGGLHDGRGGQPAGALGGAFGRTATAGASLPGGHLAVLVAALGSGNLQGEAGRARTRRAFLKSALLLSGAVWATACGGGDPSPRPPVLSDPGEGAPAQGGSWPAGGAAEDGGVDGGAGGDNGGGYVSGGGEG